MARRHGNPVLCWAFPHHVSHRMNLQRSGIAARRARLPLTVALAAALPARADSGWEGLGMLWLLGVLPLLILLAAFVVSLFVSRAPWTHKMWIALGIAASLVGMLVVAGSHAVAVPMAGVPMLWLIPAVVWAGLAYWLRKKR